MYNGVRLKIPRGSGTSGHVQASKFLVKPRASSSGASGLPGPEMWRPNKDILEHDRKRQVELRLLVLRDALGEQGYTEGEIEERVEAARKDAELEAAAAAEEGRPPLPGEGLADTQSHHVVAWKKNQLETLRAALRLDAEDVQKKGMQKGM
uniref:CWF21 domain-containing protein n=1 Tax=Arundo donax TaxID=35708 RepID=A0A0A9AZY3_ARUDO